MNIEKKVNIFQIKIRVYIYKICNTSWGQYKLLRTADVFVSLQYICVCYISHVEFSGHIN